jgi:hypothetical protein
MRPATQNGEGCSTLPTRGRFEFGHGKVYMAFCAPRARLWEAFLAPDRIECPCQRVGIRRSAKRMSMKIYELVIAMIVSPWRGRTCGNVVAKKCFRPGHGWGIPLTALTGGITKCKACLRKETGWVARRSSATPAQLVAVLFVPLGTATVPAHHPSYTAPAAGSPEIWRLGAPLGHSSRGHAPDGPTPGFRPTC